MAKIGHEAPHFDNGTHGPKPKEADSEQLQLGDTVPEPEPELPVGLRLEPEIQAAVDRLIGQDVDPISAVYRRAPRAIADRHANHLASSKATARYTEAEAARQAADKAAASSKTDDVAKLIRSTFADGSEEPPASPPAEHAA